MVYAAAFSGFYVAMILVLASLFFRPVSFYYSSKIEDMRWRGIWDWGVLYRQLRTTAGNRRGVWQYAARRAVPLACVIMTARIALFPFIMPSSIEPGISHTMWDAPSSQRTLTVMTFAAMIFVPIILAYTSWCYYKMQGTSPKNISSAIRTLSTD